jgi:hypothetical protein
LAYEQEFEEAQDGIIELPRVISGYEINSYMWWAAINELGLHYINSHSVHPTSLLNNPKEENEGWLALRDSFEEYVSWLSNAAPGLRNMTSREGAMAVQRFDRLILDTNLTDNTYSINMENFYDEAWFMLHARSKPASVYGGIIYQVSSEFYLIKALEPEISIEFLE